MASNAFSEHRAAKLITCIVPGGDGLELAATLYETHQLTGVNVVRGRGASQRSSTFADEVDVLTVIVPTAQANAIFAEIYAAAGIETKPHRFMFQLALGATTTYTLPDLPQSDP